MVEEVFAEVLVLVDAVAAVDEAEAVEEAAVPGVASQRTRKSVSTRVKFSCKSNVVVFKHGPFFNSGFLLPNWVA